MSNRSELAVEQRHLTHLYRRLDELRAETDRRLSQERQTGGGTPQARSQRDAFTGRYAERAAQLTAVEAGLCFGRLDPHDGDPLHIGRIGLHDDDRQLLVDWRAPAARPFYTATAITPCGVARRRHIRTRERTVTGLDDEILDPGRADDSAPVTGEAALLAALTANRTGRMRDIVSTIQAEQDRVIRADLGGVLVVQGGPGTGKTAVALHRAAYLLYTHRDQLASRGVLIVGPNATFLRYISQVLPSLAETGVLLATPGDLYPGVTARRPEPPRTAEIKGRATMVEILQAAVRNQQRVPQSVVEIEVDRHPLRLEPAVVRAAGDRARASGRLHNPARPVFAAAVLDALAAQVAERIGDDPFWADPLGEDDALDSPNVLDAADLADIRADLAAVPAVRALLDELWPVLTPEQLLDRFYASGRPLLTPDGRPLLTPDEQDLLRREPGGGWTPADVPLLDEAAELLGTDDRAERAAAARDHRSRLAYAQGILDITAGSKAYELEDDDEAATTLPVGTDLEENSVLLTVTEAKGLEFDTVVVVDPAGIIAESPRGANDLYVALTRPTRRLGVFTPAD